MSDIGQITNAMIAYYAGDPRRINHFLKVYGFAKTIGEMEKLDDAAQKIVEIAALTHDIGIKNSEKKYNSSAGSYQQIEGPSEARKLLKKLNVEDNIINRVCWLIAHHHTYADIQGIDYQILVEADFIVNAFEDSLSVTAIENFKEKVFKTSAGTAILNKMYEIMPD